jgi:predicted Zn-dependent protease with MMP-like domain
MRRREFERLVLKALEAIPERFQAHLADVAVIVEDWPSDELLEQMGMDPKEETLFGFYEGTPAPDYFKYGGSFDSGMTLPDRIFIYQGPIEGVCTSRAEIVEEVRKTVMHEVGHFFGLSEEEVEHL